PTTGRLLVLTPAVLVTLLLSLALIVLLRPWLARLALARPNARSSHQAPTPQGGGIAVMAPTLPGVWGAIAPLPDLLPKQGAGQFLTVTLATMLLMLIGAIDDVRSLPVATRLAAQSLAVAAVIASLPNDVQIVPLLPWWVERGALFIGGLWFV